MDDVVCSILHTHCRSMNAAYLWHAHECRLKSIEKILNVYKYTTFVVFGFVAHNILFLQPPPIGTRHNGRGFNF